MKIHYKLLPLISVLIGFSVSSLASEFQALDHFIKAARTQTDSHFGTAVIVIRDGKIVFEQNYGYADIANKKPVTEHTVFYTGSVTKPLFALATLLNQQRYGYDQNISLKQMLPGLDLEHLNSEAVTLKGLLSHSVGLHDDDLTMATAYTGSYTQQSIDKLISNMALSCRYPAGSFNYTNVGYNITSHWMDKAFAKPWQKVMEESLFTPLNMNSSTAYVSEAKAAGADIAKSYARYGSAPLIPLQLTKQDNTMHAAGGVLSTTRDLAKFVQGVIKLGKVDFEQRLPEQVIRQSLTPLVEIEADEFSRGGHAYGWGWIIKRHKNAEFYYHSGGYAGAHALVSFSPSDNMGIIVLANELQLARKMTDHIAQIGYGVLLNDPVPTSETQQYLKKLVDRHQRLLRYRQQDRAEKAKRPWLLSLDKKAYTGVYQHELLGTVHLSLGDDDSFRLNWGDIRAQVTPHKYPDVMRSELTPLQGGTRISFEFSETGAIDGLKLDYRVFKKVK